MRYLTRFIAILMVAGALAACSSVAPPPDTEEYVRVNKEELEAAERFLVAQVYYQPVLEAQQKQLTESLALLQDYLDDAKEFLNARERLSVDSMRLSPPEPESSTQPSQPRLDKQVVGEVENILLTNENVILEARIDTGATTSSLHAKSIENFERNGDDWVRFTIVNPETGEDMTLERQRVRRVRITQASADEYERRPVVNIHVTVGRIGQVAEFTLSNRSEMEFPMLIGRNVLRDVMVVDVSARNFAPPMRPDAPETNEQEAQAES